MKHLTIMKIAASAFVLAFISILASCVSTPKAGYKIPAGKVILVGRLDPGLDLKEFFGVKDEEALGLRVAFNSAPPETASAATYLGGYSPDDDYFAFILSSRPELFLREFTYVPDVSFTDQLQLVFDFERLAVNIPQGAQLIYIGDIRVGYDKDDIPRFSVDDGYDQAVARFKDYYKDATGACAVPLRALAKGSDRMEATRVTHRVYVRREF
jgi:hypothetical protein